MRVWLFDLRACDLWQYFMPIVWQTMPLVLVVAYANGMVDTYICIAMACGDAFVQPPV